jgi:hypothetical protein
MAKFRKKPVVIDAVKWYGHISCIGSLPPFESEVSQDLGSDTLQITTLEGTMTANVGDWIIRGVKGEIYPCKPDIFETTYEAVD